MGTFQYSGNVIGIMLLSFILSSMLLRCPTLCTASSSTNGGSSRSFGLQLEIVSKIEPQSVVIQNPAKSYLKGNRRDQTLIVDDGADNASSAYLKCYGALDEVATSTLNQEDYIVFLQTMTDGGISVSGFQELPAVFAMIFYTAAYVGEDDCVGDNVPAIEIGTTEEPAGDLQLFCKQILKSTESVTETPFEYSIRYDSSTLEEGTLANCLAEATVNILLEQLTTCVAAEGRRRLSESRELASAVRKTISNLQGEQSQRFLQVLGSASSGAIDCDYRIDVTVDRITDSGESSSLQMITKKLCLCRFIRGFFLSMMLD